MKKYYYKLLLAASSIFALIMTSSIPVYAYRYHYHSRSSGSPWQFVIIVIVAIALSCIPVAKAKKKKEIKYPKDYTNNITAEATSYDPYFNGYGMIKNAEEYLIQLTNAISDRDCISLREKESEELFSRQQADIEDLLADGRIRLISDVKVLRSSLHLYRRDKNYEYLTICVSAELKDYIIDQNSYKLLEGQKKLMVKHFLITYMRSKNAKNIKDIGKRQNFCPNCGAPIALNSSRQCSFCLAIIRAEEFDWVISDVEELTETDAPDNRGILIEDNSDVKFTKEKSPYFTGYYDNGIEDQYKDPFAPADLAGAFKDYYTNLNEYEERKNNEYNNRRTFM